MNMIVFEFRDAEKSFFEKHKFQGYNITFFKESLDEDFVEKLDPELLENTHIISVFINSVVNKSVIDKFKNLRIISTRSTGYDHICVNTCQYKNIAVVNVVNYGETSVAQFTFGLILALIRNLPAADRVMKKLQPRKGDFVGRDISKLTLGVVGTGAIGAAVCKIGKSFGMNLLAFDINEKKELVDKFDVKYVPLLDLVQKSDIITLHFPYKHDNYHMFNNDLFEKCKDGMYFINTSRGELVDIEALCKYFENGKIKGIALDVLTCEGLCFSDNDAPEHIEAMHLDCMIEVRCVEKLSKYDNVIITPHIAYETQDAIDYILEKTMENIRNTINGDKMCRIV